MKARVEVVEQILSDNDQLALENQKVLDDANVFALNMMACATELALAPSISGNPQA